MTNQQREALKRIHAIYDVKMPFHIFIETAKPEIGWPDTLMIKVDNLWIGIEPDGYAHT